MVVSPRRILKEELSEATFRAKAIGPLKGSILRGNGTAAGLVGKIIYYKLFQQEYPDVKYIKNNNISVNGKSIAIRIKQRSVDPQDFYNCSATLASLKEKFDYIAFGQVDMDLSVFYPLGIISWDRFMKEGFILHRGEKDGKFIVREDCKNIKIGDLTKDFTI